jgi:hypothetical protein
LCCICIFLVLPPTCFALIWSSLYIVLMNAILRVHRLALPLPPSCHHYLTRFKTIACYYNLLYFVTTLPSLSRAPQLNVFTSHLFLGRRSSMFSRLPLTYCRYVQCYVFSYVFNMLCYVMCYVMCCRPPVTYCQYVNSLPSACYPTIGTPLYTSVQPLWHRCNTSATQQ